METFTWPPNSGALARDAPFQSRLLHSSFLSDLPLLSLTRGEQNLLPSKIAAQTAPCDTQFTRRTAMSKESTQTALGKFAEAVNTGKFELIDEVVAPECVDHDPAEGQVPGPDGYRFFFSGMRTAFPDLNVAAEAVVQDGDSLAFAYTLTGTHTGPLGKIPPTGKKVKIRGVQISKFKDGKMVERWGSSDEFTLLKQIGVIPA